MSHLDHHEPDHDAPDDLLKAFMLAHDEPDYTVALARVMQLDEIDEPAPQPAASPDAESVFDSLTRTRVLEEGHRHLFLERYPPNAAVWADPQPGGRGTSWRRSAAPPRRSGMSPPTTEARARSSVRRRSTPTRGTSTGGPRRPLSPAIAGSLGTRRRRRRSPSTSGIAAPASSPGCARSATSTRPASTSTTTAQPSRRGSRSSRSQASCE
jgi:hypothetical protein